MTDPVPVLAAGQRRTLHLGGVAYTVRALTYADHSRLQALAAQKPAPGPALIDDALAEAARRGNREDLADAIAALHDAEDEQASLFAAAPPGLDHAGRLAWHREHEAEIRALERTIRGGLRKRALAMEMFAADDRLAELRARADAALVGASARLVAAGLVEIDGAPVEMDEAAASALPLAHVRELTGAISALMSVSEDAAKN